MKKKNHKDRGHAEYGASKSERWLACPGSIALEKKCPEQASNASADEGTRAHEALEYVLKNARKMSLKTLKIDLEALGHNGEAISHAITTAGEIFRRVPKGAELLCETEVDSSYFTKPGQFGTVDAAIADLFGTLEVIDYKYGASPYGVVDPEENTQGIYYALAISKQYHHNFERVKITIMQPRAPSDRGPYRSWEISMKELLSWEKKFRDGVKACEAPNPPLNPDPRGHCHYCRAKSICPALSGDAMAKAKIAFSASKMGSEPTKLHGLVELSAPANITLKLQAADALEVWIKAVREEAERELYAGKAVAGYKLVPAQARRKWANEAAAQKAIYAKFGPGVMHAPELRSPNQLEEMFAKATNFDQLRALIKTHAPSVSSGYTMVPESDRRSAVNPAAEVFKATQPKQEKK